MEASPEMVKYAMAEILKAEGSPRLTAAEHERFERRTRLGCAAVLRFEQIMRDTGDPGPLSAKERKWLA